MNVVCRVVLAASVLAVATSAVAAPRQQPAGQQPQQTKPDQQQTQKPEEEQPQKYEETVVVSGSKTEEKLINAPVTMTVITADTIENAPTRNFAELLRSVPGLNLTQVSARDINVTTRSATGTLATGQLALLDGRSLYQDFFGFVMWDFLPVNLNEIKQIEVIRGPASAVWGANAFNGVVNVISKSPREIQGTSVTVGLGTFNRSVDDDDPGNGSLVYFSGTHAQAINDRWAFKLSGGGYSQDALPRPTGLIPGSPPPGTAYPAFNEHRHDAAEARWPHRLRLRGRPEPVVLRRVCRHRRHHAHRHRALRHQPGLDDGLCESQFQAPGIAGEFLHESPRRQCLQPADARRQLPADRLRLQDQDLRLRSDQRQCAGEAQRPQLRRQPALQQLRSVARARCGQPHRVRRLRPGRDLPFQPLPVDRRRPHRSLRLPRRRRVLAAHDVHDQADRAACAPAVVQPRLSLALGHQQLPRRHRGRADQPRRVQSGTRRPGLPAADPVGRQPGSDRGKARRLRDRRIPASSPAAPRSRPPSTSTR